MKTNNELRLAQWVGVNGETSLIAFAVFAALLLLAAFITNSVSFAGKGLSPYLRFFWANFLKPHEKINGGQQSALESFYAAQVGFLPCDQPFINSNLAGWHIRHYPKAPTMWTRRHACLGRCAAPVSASSYDPCC